jgi:hypothetical protein
MLTIEQWALNKKKRPEGRRVNFYVDDLAWKGDTQKQAQ